MKNYKTIIIIGVAFLLLIGQWTYFNKQNLKLIKIAKQEISKQSPEEVIFNKATESSEVAERTLISITSLKEKIIELETTYEFNVLQKRCYNDQLTRKINKQEVIKGYCEETDNINSFKKKL